MCPKQIAPSVGSPDELDEQAPHAPERRALDHNLNRPRKLGALGERVVDVDGLP